MSKRLTSAGAKIVEALAEFHDALKEGRMGGMQTAWFFHIPCMDVFPRKLDIGATSSLDDYLACLTIATHPDTYHAIAKRPKIYGEGISAEEAISTAMLRLEHVYGCKFDPKKLNHDIPPRLATGILVLADAKGATESPLRIAVSAHPRFMEKLMTFRVITRKDGQA